MKKKLTRLFLCLEKRKIRLWIMKLTVLKLVLLMSLLTSYGKVNCQLKISKLKLENVELSEALEKIEAQTEYDFVFNYNDVKGYQVSVDLEAKTLDECLNKVLNGLPFQYKTEEDLVIVSYKKPQPKPVQQEKREIKGKVTDKDGVSLPGVSVILKGTSLGVSTDIDGKYSLKIPGSRGTIVFSFVGMLSQEYTYYGQSILNVVLKANNEGLEEVVVVGYGQTKLEDFTGSVASVDKETISKATYPNVTSMLEGNAAGVQTLTNDEPGGGTSISVRGIASLGSSTPLYIVDGSIASSGIIASIPASSILSIDVLKDASSTAIYGSRGANGIVMITTKSGYISEKPRLVFNHYTKVDKPYYERRPLTGDEYRKVLIEAADREVAIGDPDPEAQLIHDQREDYFYGNNIDWLDQISQLALTNNDDISISGGGKSTQYFMTLSSFVQDGVIKNDHLEKLSGRLRLDYQINDWVSVKTNTFISNYSHDDVEVSLHDGLNTSPDDPIYNDDGTFFRRKTDNVMQKFDLERYNNRLLLSTNIGLEIKPIENLVLKSTYYVHNSINRNTSFNPSYTHLGGFGTDVSGKGSESYSKSISTSWDNTISYNLQKEKNKLDMVVGMSLEESKGDFFSANGQDYPMDDILIGLGDAAVPSDVSGGITSTTGLAAFFARLNYIYNDKYLFTLTNRYDGSSSFGQNKKFGYFPSGAVAWKLSKESFFDVSAINSLTLKCSYGITGSQNLPHNAHINTYETTEWYNLPGLKNGNGLGNPDLRWETSKQLDLSVEFKIFNRITGSVNYYHKKTDDLLYRTLLPESTGKSSIYQNIGTVENKGIELNLGYKYKTEDFRFSAQLNVAGNRNKLTSLTEEGNLDSFLDAQVYGSRYNNTNIVGYSMGQILGYVVEGTFGTWEEIAAANLAAQEASGNVWKRFQGQYDRPGYYKFKDLNGDGFIDKNDKTIIGCPEPKFFGGLNTSFGYKGLELMLNFDFIVGGDRIYSAAQSNLSAYGTNSINYNLERDWKLGDTSADFPALYINDPMVELNDRQVYKTTYLRLKDIRLDYTFPRNYGFINEVSLYASASNVFVLTNYPGAKKVGSSYMLTQENAYYPEIKSYTVGVQLKF